MSWWWTITCLKHVEDKLSEINYYEKCASCWSFPRICITMHGSGHVKDLLELCQSRETGCTIWYPV
jgi:hypothetical protein